MLDGRGWPSGQPCPLGVGVVDRRLGKGCSTKHTALGVYAVGRTSTGEKKLDGWPVSERQAFDLAVQSPITLVGAATAHAIYRL